MAYRKTSGAPGSTGHRGLAPEPKSHKQSQREAQELLARFGGQIMEMLKAGGNKLDSMDRAYVDKLESRTNPSANLFNTMTRGVPIKDIIQAQGDAESSAAALIERAYQAGVLGSNVASRYGLPAGAAVLGAKGLADITGGMYDEASDIPMY